MIWISLIVALLPLLESLLALIKKGNVPDIAKQKMQEIVNKCNELVSEGRKQGIEPTEEKPCRT